MYHGKRSDTAYCLSAYFILHPGWGRILYFAAQFSVLAAGHRHGRFTVVIVLTHREQERFTCLVRVLEARDHPESGKSRCRLYIGEQRQYVPSVGGIDS